MKFIMTFFALIFILNASVDKTQNTKAHYSNYYSIKPSSRMREDYFQPISIGTTRFEHTREEYVRVFETSEDGFVKVSVNPAYCMNRITLLTNYGLRVAMVGKYNVLINKEIAKGKYKIMFKTEASCNVNIVYK